MYSICHKLHVQKMHVDLIIFINVKHSTLTIPYNCCQTQRSLMLSGTLMLRPQLKMPLKEPRMMLTHGMVKRGLKGLFLAALSKSAVD